MELVDLTDKWQHGRFYKVAAFDQCDGCVFYPDKPKDKVPCWDALGCESKSIRVIYINIDEASVVEYVKGRLNGKTN